MTIFYINNETILLLSNHFSFMFDYHKLLWINGSLYFKLKIDHNNHLIRTFSIYRLKHSVKLRK